MPGAGQAEITRLWVAPKAESAAFGPAMSITASVPMLAVC